MTTAPDNQPNKRTQTPEDAMARIAGVPRTAEESQADREALEQERIVQAQKMGGTYQGHAETERGTSPAPPKTTSASSKSPSSDTPKTTD
jgi:hypothetical protein